MECIGKENLDKINDSSLKMKEMDLELRYLKEELKLFKKNTPTVDALHEVELRIKAIESSLSEMRDNNKENKDEIRQLKLQIQQMQETIEDIYSSMEEYIKTNTEVLFSIKEVTKTQTAMQDDISSITTYIEEQQLIHSMKFITRYKKWAKKNKFNSTVHMVIMCIMFVAIFLTIVSLYTDMINGANGKTAWDMLIELLSAVGG